MLIARRIGAVILIAAAVAVWFVLKPADEAAQTVNFGPDIKSALADYATNNSSTDSAPQQQVVNGWVAKDLLEVIAREQNAALSPKTAPSDERIPAELLLLVMGVSLVAFTSTRQGGGVPPTGPIAPSYS